MPLQQTTPEGVAGDVRAAVQHLRGAGVAQVYTVGFCFGGGYSWRQSTDTAGLAGSVGFYGRPSLAEGAIAGAAAPLLMLMAGDDASIPLSDSEALAEQARAAGVSVEHVVYDGAPHSFFDRSFAEHEGACADAWSRIRAFVAA